MSTRLPLKCSSDMALMDGRFMVVGDPAVSMSEVLVFEPFGC